MKENEFTDKEKKQHQMFDEDVDHQISVDELWQKWTKNKGDDDYYYYYYCYCYYYYYY